MKQPFKVGEIYRNELGEYEVLSINDSIMHIRYRNGVEQDVGVALQQRIWKRLQNEDIWERQAEEQRAKSKSKRQANAKRRSSFQGLVETDFKDSIRGTTWRARTGLGGLLARQLSALTGKSFKSHAVARQSRVFVKMPNTTGADQSLHEAKFQISLDDKGAHYNFYVEKNNGEMDASWDWLRVLEALSHSVAVQGAVKKAMKTYDLQWEIHLEKPDGRNIHAATVVAAADGLRLRNEADDQERELDWQGFVDYLKNIDDADWCDLYLTHFIPKEKAIELGVSIAGEVAKTWNALMPLYLAARHRGGAAG